MRRLSIRVRLTVLYGTLFFVAGTVLLGVTYLLVTQAIAEPRASTLPFVAINPAVAPAAGGGPVFQRPDGEPVSAEKVTEMLVAQQRQARADLLSSLLTRGGVALLGVGVVAIGFGWLLAERGLRPVHHITATARRVAAGASTHRGLHERIGLSGPRDEVKELADTFDEMLERLDRSFDGQRRFVANASHELRTPLAINRALVEVAITRPGASPDARQLGENLLAVNARHERLIDGLLTLADSENPVTKRSTVDLRDVLAHVLDQPPARTVTVAERRLATAPVLGDPVLLERLAQNLVDNAVRHNRPDGWLSVGTGTAGGYATLTVTNTGPVVAPYEMESIFEPFRRLGGERTGAGRGLGLGLSIARAVARAHGGDLTAVPRPDGGLIVTARFPGPG
jgi:signal transduction histidine kinase